MADGVGAEAVFERDVETLAPSDSISASIDDASEGDAINEISSGERNDVSSSLSSSSNSNGENVEFEWCCSSYPCFANRGRGVSTLFFLTVAVIGVVLYFTVPWTEPVENFLDWVDGLGFWGVALLFASHLLSMLVIFGPMTSIELGWVFIRGWIAVPTILLSYVIGIAFMLFVGNTVLRRRILRRVQGTNILRATQRVLQRRPYSWFAAFQYWGVLPWRAGVYCAPVLAPDADVIGIGASIFLARLPMIVYDAFLATTITDLDSLVTGRLDTPLTTGVFWCSIVLTTIISVLLYFKIRASFLEAVEMDSLDDDSLPNNERD